MIEDFVAAAMAEGASRCTGKLGAVGFCFGGGDGQQLAVRLPDLARRCRSTARQPRRRTSPKIKAPLLLHYAGNRHAPRRGAGRRTRPRSRPRACRTTGYIYEGAQHGFHNDTTPRYDEAAAKLAWQRTIEFFNKYLR